MMSKLEPISDNKYQIQTDLTNGQFLNLLEKDAEFRVQFTDILRDAPFRSFFWECAPMTKHNLDGNFESVIVRADGLAARLPEFHIFERECENSETNIGIFENLGGDAMMVVPKPMTDHQIYTDIASFLRGAPPSQVGEFWQAIAKATKSRLSNAPLWLNTSGGGVAWLHGRVDSRPKYYSYAPFREFPNP